MNVQTEPSRCNYTTGGSRCKKKATHVLHRRYFDEKWDEPLCDDHAKPSYHPPDLAKRIEPADFGPADV